MKDKIMTMHYGDTVTAEQIWLGWKSHGRSRPIAFAILSPGDSIAYNAWEYLYSIRHAKENPSWQLPTPEEYCASVPDDKRAEITHTPS